MSGVSKNKKTEEDCSCFAESRTKKTCPPIRNVTHPLRYYEFTADELKALEECDKESFYQRCLPFSTLFATVTYAAIKYGKYGFEFLILVGTPRKLHRRFVSRNPHFGAVPKILVAAYVGHIYGRLSYITECDSKLRGLPPNSHLGNVMRKYYLENNPPPDPNKRQ